MSPDGKPVSRYFPEFDILGSSGRDEWDQRPENQNEPVADSAYMSSVDRKHYWNGRFTDEKGRLTFPNLVPGAKYRITDLSTMNVVGQGATVRRDFVVNPGEKLDLGEVIVAKPPPVDP